MSFDLSKIGKGVWFKYCDSVLKEDGTPEFLPPEKDAEEICVKMPSSDFMRELAEKTTTMTTKSIYNTKTRAMEMVTYPEQRTPEQWKAFESGFANEAIESWKITTPDKKPIPCNKENKVLLMQVAKFNRFIWKCASDQDAMVTAKAEASEKNLSTTQSGDLV